MKMAKVEEISNLEGQLQLFKFYKDNVNRMLISLRRINIVFNQLFVNPKMQERMGKDSLAFHSNTSKLL
jgi:hypothetical protein